MKKSTRTLLPLLVAGFSIFGQATDPQELAPLQRRAEAGEAVAMTELARRYEVGEGCPRDAGQAILWYKRAVALGEPGAMVALGDIYDEGKCVDQNMGEAVRLYRAAVQAGSGGAMYKLAWMIEGGRGVRRDRDEATSWYQKSAEKGYPPAFTKLGELTGDVAWFRKAVAAKHSPAFAKLALRVDDQEARELIKHGAALGDPEAIYQVAVRDGSADLLRKAADLGHGGAMSRIAESYEKQQNPGETILWFSRAADAGDAAGLTWAARRIEEKELERAMEMYERAVKQGYAPAMTRLGEIKADCSLFRRAADLNDAEGSYAYATKCKVAEPQKWMERAAAAKHPEALAKLGRTAEAADAGHKPSLMTLARTDPQWLRRAALAGLPEALRLYSATFSDPGEAVRWVQRAAEAGDVPAKTELARTYEAGRGVMADKHIAQRWYQEAAAANDSYAMYRLGVLSGDETWVRKAAEAGQPEAMVKLGDSLVAKNREEASGWYRKAAEAGSMAGRTKLGVLTGDMDAIRRAADAGDGEAKFLLAESLSKAKKYKQAYLLYLEASDKGFAPAMMRAGDCHMDGYGASRSEVDAVNWYRKAALTGYPAALAKLKELGKTQ